MPVVAVGARMPLIAYNVNLDTSDLEIASRIAKAIRCSSGGFKYCKAIGVMLEGRNIAQVSMNLVNYEGTPIYYVFEMIRSLADRYGVRIIGSELVGLTPDGYVDETTWNSIYGNFALADYFLRRDTVRAQSLGEDALPVMAEDWPDGGAERWGDTPRMGQYQGRPLELGQMDGQNGQRGVKV